MYTIASTSIMILPVKILVIMLILIESYPVVTSVNGNSSDVNNNEFGFSNTLKPHIYNNTSFCEDG